MGDRWGAAFVRIGWQASFGLGGSFAPDWVAGIIGIRRGPQPAADRPQRPVQPSLDCRGETLSAAELSLSRFKLTGPPMPRDTEASDAYALIHDSLGPV